MPFSDIIKIKQVEDVLEKYWNDHRMDLGMEYIVGTVYSSPFDFFQEFGSYWEEKKWSRIGHQPEDLFKRLVEFIGVTNPDSLKTLIALLKVDYLSQLTFKPRKPWWEYSMTKNEKSPIYQAVLANPHLVGEKFKALNLNEKELYKHVLIDELSIDMNHYLETGEIITAPTLLIAYFHPKHGGSKLFYVPSAVFS